MVAVQQQLQLSALLLLRIAAVAGLVRQRPLGLPLVRGLPVTPEKHKRSEISNPIFMTRSYSAVGLSLVSILPDDLFLLQMLQPKTLHIPTKSDDPVLLFVQLLYLARLQMDVLLFDG